MKRELHRNFPNRDELVSTVERATQRVQQVSLQVESVDSVRVRPWMRVAGATGEATERIAADCVVRLRLRLGYDGRDGQHHELEPGRAEWTIRFERKVKPDARP